jgi:hypothetical protein
MHVRNPRIVPIIMFCAMFFVLVCLRSPGQAANGTLAWDAPTHNTDGTPLTDLIGYTIYYWQPDWPMPLQVDIGNQTACTLTDLEVDKTYFFSVTAVSSSGRESVFADTIHMVFPTHIDTDGDRLSDEAEQTLYGTNPALADTDGDGLRDGDEVALWGAMWAHDVDGDGLPNLLDADADNDGIGDEQEFILGADPANSASQPAAVSVWLEAEAGQLSSFMRIATNAEASASQYVWVPPSPVWVGEPHQIEGSVHYRFHVPQDGTYVIWGRVRAGGPTENSFYVALDDSAFFAWHVRASSAQTWSWDVISDRPSLAPRDFSTPFLFALGAGEHTLMVLQRESGTQLDQLLITNDITLIPNDTAQTQ